MCWECPSCCTTRALTSQKRSSSRGKCTPNSIQVHSCIHAKPQRKHQNTSWCRVEPTHIAQNLSCHAAPSKAHSARCCAETSPYSMCVPLTHGYWPVVRMLCRQHCYAQWVCNLVLHLGSRARHQCRHRCQNTLLPDVLTMPWPERAHHCLQRVPSRVDPEPQVPAGGVVPISRTGRLPAGSPRHAVAAVCTVPLVPH